MDGPEICLDYPIAIVAIKEARCVESVTTTWQLWVESNLGCKLFTGRWVKKGRSFKWVIVAIEAIMRGFPSHS